MTPTDGAVRNDQDKLQLLHQFLEGQSRTVAIVSGKGGSGKTMFIATAARVLDEFGFGSTLVDTDIGTGGLSYYLSVNYARGIGQGLCEMVSLGPPKLEIEGTYLHYYKNLAGFSSRTRFVSVGDHRKLLRNHDEERFRELVGDTLKKIAHEVGGVILLDCRGGIDEDSLAVCKAADDIVLIAETDPASFQTTQYLVDVLSDRDLSHKIKGFVVNRVFDDPSVVVRQGTTAFRAAYLGSIPFDLTAIRDFNVGTIPARSTTFSLHTHGALARMYPELFEKLPSGLWEFKDFKVANIDDPESVWGGRVIALLVMYVLAIGVSVYFFSPNAFRFTDSFVISVASSALAIVAAGNYFRRALGRAVLRMTRLLSRRPFGRSNRYQD